MYRFFDRLARLFAQLGGLVLVALIVLTCLSIAGRLLNGLLHSHWFEANAPEISESLIAWGVGPINGDFELVEAGMAFAIFAFLPLCQLRGAHAAVDIFTSRLPQRIDRLLTALIDIVFAVVLVLIAWQLFEGTLSKQKTGQTTFSLEFPLWWAYALSLSAAVVAAIVSVFIALSRLVEISTGRTVLPVDLGTEH